MGVASMPTVCRFDNKVKIEHLVGEWFKMPVSESSSICYIGNCRNAAIIILGAVVDQVIIRACENCQIIIAACLGSIRIENTKSSVVRCAARSIQILKSSNCLLFTFCLKPVGADAECSNLVFGPFNAVFSQHKEVIGRYPDLFPQDVENPLEFVVEGGTHTCILLDPDDFVLYPVPFEQHSLSAFLLPAAYQQGLQRRQARLLEVQQKIQAHSAQESLKRTIQSELEHHFKIWLRDSGEQVFIDLFSKPMFREKLQSDSQSLRTT